MGNRTTERLLRSVPLALAAALLAPLPQAAAAQGWESVGQRSVLQREIAGKVGKDLKPFYAARQYRPLWLNELGQPSGAASMLMHYLRTAQLDGVDPEAIDLDRLAKRLDKARKGDEDDAAKAEVELSAAFAAYVRAMIGADRDSMLYESDAVRPMVPTQRAALDAAGHAGSIESYVADMGWMHPLYAPLRKAIEDTRFSPGERQQMAANLARVRALPAVPQGKHIVVDAASAQLFMYEDGRVVDTMKVVVGKPELQTPMMAGLVRYAIVNPYWNVPDDLTRNNIAPNVISKGVKYLKAGGYEVFANWADDSQKLDPAKVDWRAVRDGRAHVRVRQLPGGDNFMGLVKFEFPNLRGIYMHDTPDKHLLEEEARQLSSGCVRLEDAARMHAWLMDAPLPAKVAGDPEQTAQLPAPVPIFITYLTTLPAGGQIAFNHDPYKRDMKQPFAASGHTLASVD